MMRAGETDPGAPLREMGNAPAKLSNESINAWLNEKLDRVVNEDLKGCGV